MNEARNYTLVFTWMKGQSLAMEFVNEITYSLSHWEWNFTPGWQSVAASVLLAAGGWFVVSRAWTFARVLASLFVLPGKSVCR